MPLIEGYQKWAIAFCIHRKKLVHKLREPLDTPKVLTLRSFKYMNEGRIKRG
jgi:hypothetical protein